MNFTKTNLKKLRQLINALIYAMETGEPDMEQGMDLENYLNALEKKLNE
jgi:hypothetical protein